MSQLRLYLDEDSMNRALLLALRQRNIDVITVNEVQTQGLTDEAQLLWASTNGRAICTYNVRDFSQLHQQFLSSGRSHAGIILMRQSFSIGKRLYGLSILVASMTAEDIQNQVVFLSQYLNKTAKDD
jgi:hypothetical protein